LKFIKYFVKIGLEREGTTDTNRQQSQVVKLFLLNKIGMLVKTESELQF
jgi:hypothetical protein